MTFKSVVSIIIVLFILFVILFKCRSVCLVREMVQLGNRIRYKQCISYSFMIPQIMSGLYMKTINEMIESA